MSISRGACRKEAVGEMVKCNKRTKRANNVPSTSRNDADVLHHAAVPSCVASACSDGCPSSPSRHLNRKASLKGVFWRHETAGSMPVGGSRGAVEAGGRRGENTVCPGPHRGTEEEEGTRSQADIRTTAPKKVPLKAVVVPVQNGMPSS